MSSLLPLTKTKKRKTALHTISTPKTAMLFFLKRIKLSNTGTSDFRKRSTNNKIFNLISMGIKAILKQTKNNKINLLEIKSEISFLLFLGLLLISLVLKNFPPQLVKLKNNQKTLIK
ncbi:hypothetical protein [Flavobacterium sp. 25HG05S-40]|uniref:hypothetical protein n=1 Tax=Flavobacterium sp. 25HG05S-40 TaxID=3458682 RepID=UPI004044DDAE